MVRSRILNRPSDILVLIAVGAGVTTIGSAAIILWTRIVRHGWPDRVVIFSTTIGLLGITVLSVLAYLILEH
jgi:hypothetical protein